MARALGEGLVSELTLEEEQTALRLASSSGIGNGDAEALVNLVKAYRARGDALERIRALVRSSGGSCQGEVILALASTEEKP